MLPDLTSALHVSFTDLVASRFSGYDMRMESLVTTGDVIEVLGGTAAVARLLGRSMTVVSNWKAGGCFPSNTYVVFQRALARVGRTAPDSLWRMVEPAPAAKFGIPEASINSGRAA